MSITDRKETTKRITEVLLHHLNPNNMCKESQTADTKIPNYNMPYDDVAFNEQRTDKDKKDSYG